MCYISRAILQRILYTHVKHPEKNGKNVKVSIFDRTELIIIKLNPFNNHEQTFLMAKIMPKKYFHLTINSMKFAPNSLYIIWIKICV